MKGFLILAALVAFSSASPLLNSNGLFSMNGMSQLDLSRSIQELVRGLQAKDVKAASDETLELPEPYVKAASDETFELPAPYVKAASDETFELPAPYAKAASDETEEVCGSSCLKERK